MIKDLRLKKSSDFRQVFKKGRRFLSPHFVLYVCKNNTQTARLGVALSKNHFKLATRRNRLRRVAKEIFRKNLTQTTTGSDVVIASRTKEMQPGAKQTTSELKQLILGVLQRNGS